MPDVTYPASRCLLGCDGAAARPRIVEHLGPHGLRRCRAAHPAGGRPRCRILRHRVLQHGAACRELPDRHPLRRGLPGERGAPCRGRALRQALALGLAAPGLPGTDRGVARAGRPRPLRHPRGGGLPRRPGHAATRRRRERPHRRRPGRLVGDQQLADRGHQGGARRGNRSGAVGPAFAQLKYGIARRAMAEGDAYGPLFADGTLTLQASDVFEGGILATGRMPQRKIGADVGGIRERILAVYPQVARVAGSSG